MSRLLASRIPQLSYCPRYAFIERILVARCGSNPVIRNRTSDLVPTEFASAYHVAANNNADSTRTQ